MSPRMILIATAFLASAAALAQDPGQLPPLGTGLPALPALPMAPNDTVSVVKALAHSAADLDKFISLNPKAQISQAQVSYQDDGYQVTITSQACETPAVQQPTQDYGFGLPAPLPVCKTYGSLVIQATADAEAQDGYTFQTLWNGTLRKGK